MDFYEFDRFANLKLNGNEFKVYRNLLGHRNIKETVAYPSQTTIAQETNISVASVKRAIKGLVEKKFVEIRKQKRIIGHYNVYELKYIPTFYSSKVEKVEDTVDIFEDKKEDKKANISLIEGKTGLTLTNWQKYVAKKMDKVYLLRAIGKWKRKKGRKFTFLISLYTDMLCKDGLFNEHLSKVFKVYWTGDFRQHLQQFEQKRESEVIGKDIIGWC